MSIGPIKGFLQGLIKPVTDLVGKAVVDRDKAKELEAKIEETILQYALNNEQELTKRLQIDMTSDSWLSKNIRPLSLVFLTVMFTFFAFTDGNAGGFTVDKIYIPIYSNLLITAYMFYFGSRGAEKAIKIWKEKDA